MKLYLHGLTMGTPPRINNHDRTKRGECEGWTPGATRRNLAFLRSVEPCSLEELTEVGFAVTLTVRDCPPTAEHWQRLRTAYVKRLRRMGMIRAHWVTEWQRRGVPHLHGVFWLPHDPQDPQDIPQLRAALLSHWLDLADSYGVSPSAQHITVLSHALGWFQYVAKHAARGVKHYQRSRDSIPAGWRKTGRMWGKAGDWETRDAMRLSISDDVFYRFRRLIRRWRISDARSQNLNSQNRKARVLSARQMLKCNDRGLSQVRGVSEWVDLDTALVMLDAVKAGGEVSQ